MPLTLRDELAYMQWLKTECGYQSPRPIGHSRYACIMPLLYTAAIIVGRIGDACYEDRWCYHSREDAERALDAWDGRGEPAGWHRHPTTGRRRTDGDSLREYVSP
jgi:hypothetical protein